MHPSLTTLEVANTLVMIPLLVMIVYLYRRGVRGGARLQSAIGLIIIGLAIYALGMTVMLKAGT